LYIANLKNYAALKGVLVDSASIAKRKREDSMEEL
jgi:hypothetical protein